MAQRKMVFEHIEGMDLSNSQTVLGRIERMTRRQFLPIVGPERGKILTDIIREIRPRRILEVGTLIGYSAVLMGNELGNDAHLTTIEIHADEARVARENIEKAQISAKVDVIEGDAKKVLSTLSGRFDMVFIDAEKTEYLQYLCLIEKRLHKGSVVVADNAGIFADEMRDYLDYVRSSGKYSSKYIPVGEDGVEVSIKL
jgi:predicted O-methyltransferase YrrM